MTLPLISCLCCTYGRPIHLGEAIKCFNDQDYQNKELIVLNDQEQVTLILPSCPANIRIINHPKRFGSLGEKRNYIRTLANGDYFCIWDDDDLYLPHRISKSVEYITASNYDIMKPSKAIMSVNNNQYKLVSNLFHSQACVTKKYMMNTDYPVKSVGEDIDFESNAKILSIDTKPFYIYRWGNNVHHLSGIANDKESWDRSLTYDSYKKLNGVIELKPIFQKDYWSAITGILSKYK